MKNLLCISVMVSTFTGCSSLLPTKQMEANEIFRNSADQYTIHASSLCNVFKETKTGMDANSGISKNPGNSSQGADAWSIARSYLCAVRAENDAYADQISQITAEP